MGAVSRSGLQRVFSGSTAERVLDALSCDVLVIKPRGTKTRVKPAERGMRVITPPATPLVA
jgi:universal stress protein E